MQIYWLWLAMRAKVQAKEKLALLEHFHSPEEIYFLKRQDLCDGPALSKEAVESLLDKNLKPAEKIVSDCQRKRIKILTWEDSKYPNRLKNIYDPPLVLYYKGKLPDFDNLPAIGVVGTRNASAYGLSTAQKLGGEIAACGGVVVSGMALGVDAMATHGALTESDFAVGVLGCGVDRAYPAANGALFQRMERSGCLISEYPPGTKPDKWNFPRRNRIISGLSCGVVVVEAPLKSGSLITARQALEQGRDVFVVPGNIDIPTFQGSYALLREGAIAVSSGWEVLCEYEAIYPQLVHKPEPAEEKTAPVDKIAVDKAEKPTYSDLQAEDLSSDEQTVLSCLKDEMLIDHLIAGCGLGTSAVMAAVTMLEIKGLVTTLPGGRVIRN